MSNMSLKALAAILVVALAFAGADASGRNSGGGCGRGKFKRGRSCTPCARGTYKVSDSDLACQECPAGMTTREKGSSSIKKCVCAPGSSMHGRDGKSKRSCDSPDDKCKCKCGHAKAGGYATSQSGCSACAAEYWAPAGASNCTKSVTGWVPGPKRCSTKKCPCGTYADVKRKRCTYTCKSCEGATCSPEAAASCNVTCPEVGQVKVGYCCVCDASKYFMPAPVGSGCVCMTNYTLINGTCESPVNTTCPPTSSGTPPNCTCKGDLVGIPGPNPVCTCPNQSFPSPTNISKCIPCAAPKIYNATDGSCNCASAALTGPNCTCPNGTTLNGTQCLCNAGLGCGVGGVTTCPCGFYPPGGISAVVNCTDYPCAAGFASNQVGGSAPGACQKCAAGSYSAKGACACLPCAASSYAPMGGMGNCTSCPMGTNSTMGSVRCCTDLACANSTTSVCVANP